MAEPTTTIEAATTAEPTAALQPTTRSAMFSNFRNPASPIRNRIGGKPFRSGSKKK